MTHERRHSFQRAHQREGSLKPPKFLIRAANTTIAKTTDLLHAAHKKIYKVPPKRSHHSRHQHRQYQQYPRHNDSDEILTASSNNNTDEYSDYSRRTRTMSSSSDSSTFSSMYGYQENAALPQTEPLPKPVCRLGDVQAEWEGGDVGWQLIPIDASTLESVSSSASAPANDLSTLYKINENLRGEQDVLKMKLEILLNAVAQKSAIVNVCEEKLERLRVKLKARVTGGGSRVMPIIHTNQLPQPIPARDQWLEISRQKHLQKNERRRRRQGSNGSAKIIDWKSTAESKLADYGSEWDDTSSSHTIISSVTPRTSETAISESQTTDATTLNTTSTTANSSADRESGSTRSETTMTATTKTKTVQFAD